MKKILLTLIISVLAFSNSFAKGSMFKNIEFGPRIGVGTSKLFIDDKDIKAENMRLSYSVGGFVEFKLADILAIRPEVNYTAKGGKYETDFLITKVTTDYGLRYIEIPIMAKVNFGNIGVMAGPYYAMKLSEAVTHNNSISDLSSKIIQSSDNDFGLTGGVAFKVSDALSVDLRTNYGMKEISERFNVKNFNLLFGVSYSF